MNQAASPASEVLVGHVELVTFHSDESGFCVLRVKARGHRDLVTTVGHAAMISAGEWITASGEWVNDRHHGLQFQARFLKTSEPSSIEGIEKYLGSGMIRGIGPVDAKRMVRLFGKDVFDVIEANPERLREGLATRRELSAPLMAELHTWLTEQVAKLSRGHDLTKAFLYMLKRWEAFTRFLDDGRICLTNNAAERALRCIPLGRKAWLFCG